MRSRTLTLFACLGVLGGSSLACKRRDTLPPVVFTPLDEAGDASTVHDAPAWPVPARAQLDNQALVYWQHEPESPGFHVRLLLPTTMPNGEILRAVDVLLAARTLESRLAATLERRAVEVALSFAPGRIEVVLSGPNASFRAALARLAVVAGTVPTDKERARGQGRAVKDYRVPRAVDVATVDVIARLIQRPPSSELIGREELFSTERRVDWRTFTDPRRAVLIVHTGLPADEGTELLAALAAKWPASRGDEESLTALQRLRPAWPEPVGSRTMLVESNVAPLHVVAPNVDVARGSPTLVLGRIIPTPTAVERAQARLAQRIVQEALDARLEFSGPFAVFLVRVPLLHSDSKRAVDRALADLGELAQTEHTRGRLTQAARLWLGARLVAQSLDGEDWTALWSESMDLSRTDVEIPHALAREAETMLAITPDVLSAWMREWMDPQNGQGGWTWSVAGVDDAARNALAELAKLEASEWPP